VKRKQPNHRKAHTPATLTCVFHRNTNLPRRKKLKTRNRKGVQNMSIATRKLAEQAIADSKLAKDLPNPDKQEAFLLEAMSEDDPVKALGALTVIGADLLELARRTDPAYELEAVRVIAAQPATEAVG
jgi:hypothetical protein